MGFVSGLGFFLATAILLLKGGIVIGPTLSLLGYYLVGYDVCWTGAFLGMFYGIIVGGVFGWLIGFIYNRIVEIRNRKVF